MSDRYLRDQLIALAALLQSTYIVHQLATQGRSGVADNQLLLESLLNTDPDSVLSVYGSLHHLQPGFSIMVQLFDNPKSVDILRYAMTLIKLQKKLMRRKDLLLHLSEAIKIAKHQQQFASNDWQRLYSNLSDAYSRTVSQLSPRIMVKGDSQYLRQAAIADRIRVHLLCGMRAAILWRQCGGSQWDFLIKRHKLHRLSKTLFHQSKNAHNY